MLLIEFVSDFFEKIFRKKLTPKLPVTKISIFEHKYEKS